MYCFTARWRRDNWEIKLMEQPDEHYSLVGGNLVINNPRQKKHAGTYVCVARNIYGTVISKEARVKFGCEHLKPTVASWQRRRTRDSSVVSRDRSIFVITL